MASIRDIQNIIIDYVQDYNTKLNKNLLANEDFFGDTVRILDFLNHYYTYLLDVFDVERIDYVISNMKLIRKYITGLEAKIDIEPIYQVTEDEYRRSKKGVHKVRKLIVPKEEKKDIFDSLVRSYKLYEQEFKNQVYTVYTNDNIYNFTLKEEYFPYIIGLNTDDISKEVITLSKREQKYYEQLPSMLEKFSTNAGINSLDNYERENYHSLFNYSYLKLKNFSFLNFLERKTPKLVTSHQEKIDSNICTNTFFSSIINVGKKSGYSVVGFHENSKFSEGYAESDVYMSNNYKVLDEIGITTAIFRTDKVHSPHYLELIKLYPAQAQIKFIDYLLEHSTLNKIELLKQYQNRLKRALFDQLNLEYRLQESMYEDNKKGMITV